MFFPCGKISVFTFITSVSNWLTFPSLVTANMSIHPGFRDVPYFPWITPIIRYFDKKYKFFHSQVAANLRPYGFLMQKPKTSTVTLRARCELGSTDEKVLARQKVEMRKPLATRNSTAASQAWLFPILLIS